MSKIVILFVTTEGWVAKKNKKNMKFTQMIATILRHKPALQILSSGIFTSLYAFSNHEGMQTLFQRKGKTDTF